MRLTLLGTNDLHGRLTPGLVQRLSDLKARCQPALLLDAGDAVACGNVGFRPGGEPAHDLMRAAGYDAGALGNREFHFRPGPQQCKLRRVLFPILCANLSDARGGLYGGIAPVATLTAGGVEVLVVGLCVPMVTAQMWARWLSPARFVAPAEALRTVLAEPQRGPVVVLSHLGLRRDRELAAEVPGIDVILGGHSHTATRERIGTTLICQNQPYAGSVTQVVLDVEEGRVVEADAALIPFGPAEEGLHP
ncbi:MAG: metallophosphoesterase [Armatimonadetes bacterium]|nr:metallophosphoesterase [Armatimonadota bacterium]